MEVQGDNGSPPTERNGGQGASASFGERGSDSTRAALAESLDEARGDVGLYDDPGEEEGKAAGAQPPRAAVEHAAAPGQPQPLRPPQAWRAGARAHWDKLPREVQEESLRLNIETQKVLNDTALARKEVTAWREALAPHAETLRSAGVQPQQLFGELVGTYVQLARGEPAQRTQIVADIIRQFVGTDEASLRALAANLDGGVADDAAGGAAPEPPVPAPAAQPPGIPPEQVEAYARQQAAVAIQANERAAAQAVWQAFLATHRPDLLDQVRTELAMAVTEIQRQNGGPRLSVEDFKRAYDMALKLNPKTAPIVAQREAAENAKRYAAEAPRKAAAASGIRSEPTNPGASKQKPGNTKEQLRREWQSADRGERV